MLATTYLVTLNDAVDNGMSNILEITLYVTSPASQKTNTRVSIVGPPNRFLGEKAHPLYQLYNQNQQQRKEDRGREERLT